MKFNKDRGLFPNKLFISCLPYSQLSFYPIDLSGIKMWSHRCVHVCEVVVQPGGGRIWGIVNIFVYSFPVGMGT
jgi:hypothetical protein